MRYKLLTVISITAVSAIGTMLLAGNFISDTSNYEIIDADEKPLYSNTIKMDDLLVDVRIADTDVKRNRGLMFEEPLPHDQGMLFVYEKSGNYSFWMHNVKFALDIIWFDDRGNVVHIKQNVPPCTTEPEHCAVYDPGTEAMYVFEATAGFVEKFGITDSSKFSWVEDKIT